MKVERKGNVYRKQSWLKEHENLVVIVSVVVMAYLALALAFILQEVYMNEELSEIKIDIHNKYCELVKNDTDIHKTISGILDLLGDMRKEITSLRTDVDKLIENNNGGKRYGRTA